MRYLHLLLACLMFFSEITFAERIDPMMAWVQLVQIDWNAYHGKMVAQCAAKYPDSSGKFEDAIRKWNDKNSEAIRNIHQQLKAQFKAITGIPEPEVSTQMSQASSTWTGMFIKQISSTSEQEWKDICTGKYAEMLPALYFANFLPMLPESLRGVRAEQLKH